MRQTSQLNKKRSAAGGALRGFTLVELVIALVVLAILLAIGVPSFMATIESSRVTTQANDLLAAVQLARTEAIRRGMRVTLCKKASGNQCDNSAGPWSQGWLVFTDPKAGELKCLDNLPPEECPSIPFFVPNTNAQVDSGSIILARGGDVMPSSIRIESRIGGNSNLRYVSYGPGGTSKKMDGTFLSGTVRVCSTSGYLSDDDRARDIVINNVGRAVIERPSGVASNCPAP